MTPHDDTLAARDQRYARSRQRGGHTWSHVGACRGALCVGGGGGHVRMTHVRAAVGGGCHTEPRPTCAHMRAARAVGGGGGGPTPVRPSLPRDHWTWMTEDRGHDTAGRAGEPALYVLPASPIDSVVHTCAVAVLLTTRRGSRGRACARSGCATPRRRRRRPTRTTSPSRSGPCRARHCPAAAEGSMIPWRAAPPRTTRPRPESR